MRNETVSIGRFRLGALPALARAIHGLFRERLLFGESGCCVRLFGMSRRGRGKKVRRGARGGFVPAVTDFLSPRG